VLSDYSKIPLSELRKILLNGELIHEYMTEKLYSSIINYEMSLAVPDNAVIRTCLTNLDGYEEYRELDRIDIDVEELFGQTNKNIDEDKKLTVKRSVRLTAAITFAVITVMLMAQIVGMAFGFNLFRYIFTWGKEKLVISYSNENPAEPVEGDMEGEAVFISYRKQEDVPVEMTSLMPQKIMDKYHFYEATYFKDDENFQFMFTLYLDSETFMTINISRLSDFHIQKDEDFYEEYEKDGMIVYIFKNMGYHNAIWINNDVMYNVGADLSLEEVKEIIGYF
jgi:hypothetical protein